MDLNELRKKFEADEAAVPEGSWDRLASALDQRQPKVPFYTWLAVLLFFFGMVSMGVWRWNKSVSEQEVALKQPSETISAPSQPVIAPKIENNSNTNEPAKARVVSNNIVPNKSASGPEATKTSSSSDVNEPNTTSTEVAKASEVNAATSTKNPILASSGSKPAKNKLIAAIIPFPKRKKHYSKASENQIAYRSIEVASNKHLEYLSKTSKRTLTSSPATTGSQNLASIERNISILPKEIKGNTELPNATSKIPLNTDDKNKFGRKANSQVVEVPESDLVTPDPSLDKGNNKPEELHAASIEASEAMASTIPTIPIKTDSLIQEQTAPKPDSAITAPAKKDEPIVAKLKRFSFWAELGTAHSPKTKISPNQSDAVLMQSCNLTNNWKPTLYTGSLVVQYQLKPSLQLVGGIAWQYQQITYNKINQVSSTLESRTLNADGSISSNFSAVNASNSGTVRRQSIGLQAGANLQLLPRIQLKGMFLIPLYASGTEGNLKTGSQALTWQASLNYDLNKAFQLGAFWQQSHGNPLQMADGTQMFRGFAGVQLRYRIK